MVDSVALDRVAKRAHHVLLADHLVEGLRSVAAVEEVSALTASILASARAAAADAQSSGQSCTGWFECMWSR